MNKHSRTTNQPNQAINQTNSQTTFMHASVPPPRCQGILVLSAKKRKKKGKEKRREKKIKGSPAPIFVSCIDFLLRPACAQIPCSSAVAGTTKLPALKGGR
jgi:hypothetical protein